MTMFWAVDSNGGYHQIEADKADVTVDKLHTTVTFKKGTKQVGQFVDPKAWSIGATS